MGRLDAPLAVLHQPIFGHAQRLDPENLGISMPIESDRIKANQTKFSVLLDQDVELSAQGQRRGPHRCARRPRADDDRRHHRHSADRAVGPGAGAGHHRQGTLERAPQRAHHRGGHHDLMRRHREVVDEIDALRVVAQRADH